MKTVLEPCDLNSNQYISIVRSYIEECGYSVVSLEEFFKNKGLRKECKIINLNWFDSLNSRNLFFAIYRLVMQLCKLEYMRLNGSKIIFTLHNIRGHEAKYTRLSNILLNKICKLSDRIIILCGYSKTVLENYLSDEEIEKKAKLMYHPSYDDVYPKIYCNIRELESIGDTEKMRVLFMGAINPYKNCELIVEAANELAEEPIEFLIAGHPINMRYQEYLNAKISENAHITSIYRFIQDKEIWTLYQWADIVVLPLSIDSCLNSGSAMLAFSMKKTVVIPMIGTVLDFPKKDLYLYNYSSEKEHKTNFLNELKNALNDWKKDSNILRKKGMNLYNYMIKLSSREKMIERYKQLYSELEN